MLPGLHDITLVMTPADELLQTNIRILKHFLRSFDSCLYLSVNFNYSRLADALRRARIDPSRFFVIDCIGGRNSGSNHHISLPSPAALTEIGIASSQALASMAGRGFLVVDALSTLVIYNPPQYVARFAHFLISKAKAAGIPAVFLAVEKETSETLYAEVAQFCDRVLKPQQLKVG